MDPKNESDLDATMESKRHYKLRSSLKKTKSRNPLGSLDITEANVDITLAHQQRRVSFAASNYVKPFMDDPEKNTIWDNTYEEEVNHTDSTKSENTYHTNLSEHKSNCQEITNHQFDLQNKECITNIYCDDESIIDMEVSCFDQTIVNEEVQNVSLCDSNLDTTSCIVPNVDVKNTSDLSGEASFNMEFTCQWKNKIIQPSTVQKDVPINKDYLLRNSTVYQEMDMSMTCCFGKAENQESRLLPADVAESSEIVYGIDTSTKNKENILPSGRSGCFKRVCAKNENIFLPDQTEMEFTCNFPNKIIETINQHEGKENNSLAKTTVNEIVKNKENMLPGDRLECFPMDYSKKEKVFLPNQSEMEFTCLFPNKILEAVNLSKGTVNNSLAMTTVKTNIGNKENMFLPGEYAKKDQSEMEFTCSFPNKILETVNQPKGIGNNSVPMTAVNTNVENKENILLPGDYAGCIPRSYAKKEKLLLPDQSEMEFTCTFPSTTSDTVNNFLAVAAVEANIEHNKNKSGNHLGCFPAMYTERENLFLPDQSEMEFTCSFPNKILEAVNQPKEIKSSSLRITSVSKNDVSKENILPGDRTGCFSMDCDTSEKVVLPEQSGKEFTYTFSNNTETVNHPKKNESDLLVSSGFNKNDQNKENILSSHAGCYPTDLEKKENIVLPDRSGMELTYTFHKRILETVNQPKKNESDSVAMLLVTENAQNKENLLPDSTVNTKITKNILLPGKVAECLSPKTDKHENVFIPHKSKIVGTDSHPKESESNSLLLTNTNISKFEYTSNIDSKQCVSHETYSSKPDLFNINKLPRTYNDSKPTNNEQNLMSNNTYTMFNTNNSQCNSTISKKSTFDICQNIPLTEPPLGSILKNFKLKETKFISMKPEVNTEMIKPVKVREFGNIPVAVDVTDSSMEQNINDQINPVSSRLDYNLKGNRYTLSVAQPVQLKNTFVGREVNNDSISHSDNVDLVSFRGSEENIIPKSVHADYTGMQSVNPKSTKRDQNNAPVINKPNSINLKRTSEIISNVKLDSPGKHSSIKQKPNTEMYLPKSFNNEQKNCNVSFAVDVPNECKDFTENNISQLLCTTKNQIKQISRDESENRINNIDKGKGVSSIAEECTLLESIEESVLINSITSPDKDELKRLGINLSQNGTQDEVSINKEDRNHSVKEEDLQGHEKIPVTKVIYSEPMKVKPFHDEFSSMQTSGMNPFNFSSIASMEDTQQLIQATFSKQSFIRTDQFEDDKRQPGFIQESNMLEGNEKNELNGTDTVALQNETLKADSIFDNIQKKLVLCKFQCINYKEITDSIRRNKGISDRMEKLLSDYKFVEICTFNLQEKTKKMSLPYNSSNGNSSDSLLEMLESGEDNDKSMLLEPTPSLHEKIINVCTRSNKVLNIKYFEDSSYIFNTMFECILIYVQVHPEDGRVTDIKTASSLYDSMDIIHHFLVKNILDKLKQSTLISYLGPYYDVLSLLDHICLTVDEVMEFHYEFLSLQKLYPQLRINSDYSISLEILHNNPPVWWTIRIHMTSVNKINPEVLHLESKWDNINEEHIKQILINIDEGVESLRSFISNVFKYFERTQLRFKVQ